MAQKRRHNKYLKLGLVLIALGLAVYFVFIRADKSSAPGGTVEQQNSTPETEQTKPKFISLQPVLDKWNKNRGGTASVIIYDLDNDREAASVNSEQSYFGASLYKLFVAYEGYIKVSAGEYDFDEPYLGGYTIGECLDKMIRESYSPCAEKMWVELGKESLNAKLETYGINNTSMTALTTTAEDVSAILKRIYAGQGLTDKHRSLYLDSMKTQPELYRRGLPSGFSKATVYNKVGWNLLVEWHDAAIVTFPSGRSYLFVALTKNVGYRNLAALGTAIEKAVVNE